MRTAAIPFGSCYGVDLTAATLSYAASFRARYAGSSFYIAHLHITAGTNVDAGVVEYFVGLDVGVWPLLVGLTRADQGRRRRHFATFLLSHAPREQLVSVAGTVLHAGALAAIFEGVVLAGETVPGRGAVAAAEAAPVAARPVIHAAALATRTRAYFLAMFVIPAEQSARSVGRTHRRRLRMIHGPTLRFWTQTA